MKLDKVLCCMFLFTLFGPDRAQNTLLVTSDCGMTDVLDFETKYCLRISGNLGIIVCLMFAGLNINIPLYKL